MSSESKTDDDLRPVYDEPTFVKAVRGKYAAVPDTDLDDLAAISAGIADMEAGRVTDIDEVARELRERHAGF